MYKFIIGISIMGLLQFGCSQPASEKTPPPSDWQVVKTSNNYNPLTEDEQRIIIHKGTEYPFTGAYYANKDKGVYLCRQCNLPLFHSKDKFNSRTGWPSFDDMIEEGAVKEVLDADGYRKEIVCSNCDGHLGHVFYGERMTKKSTRHCVNSISLSFVPLAEWENTKPQ